MIEVRHLRYFIAVAEELHFGRAADRLHMAQSPLSHQIRQLERRLGVVLLERDHHVIGLTDAGQTFLAEARALMEELDRAVDRTRRAGRGEVGSLRIGYVPEVTAGLLPLSLKAHRARFPDIEVELRQGSTGRLLDLLRRGELDVAFVRAPGPVDEIEYEELGREALVAAVPANLAGKGQGCSLSSLSAEPFVVPSYQAARGLRRDIDSACSTAGFLPKVAREAGSMTAILLLVAAGAGVAVVPASVASSYPVPGVAFVELSGTPRTGAGMAWRRAESSRVNLNFLATTRQAVEPTGHLAVTPRA